LGLTHPPKGKADTFRELVGVSHQLNALSRSSFLLANVPGDDGRKAFVRGKGNYAAEPPSVEFHITEVELRLDDDTIIDVAKASDVHEGELRVADLLKKSNGRKDSSSAAQQRLLNTLADGPKTYAEMAEMLGCSRQAVNRHIGRLQSEGLVAAVNGRPARFRRAEGPMV
jgi:biotin operon repressor